MLPPMGGGSSEKSRGKDARGRYTPEFKAEMVALVRSGVSQARAIKRLGGGSKSNVALWMKEAESSGHLKLAAAGVKLGTAATEGLVAQVKALRAENLRLRAEIEEIRKALS
jgi:transposase-like protein